MADVDRQAIRHEQRSKPSYLKFLFLIFSTHDFKRIFDKIKDINIIILLCEIHHSYLKWWSFNKIMLLFLKLKSHDDCYCANFAANYRNFCYFWHRPSKMQSLFVVMNKNLTREIKKIHLAGTWITDAWIKSTMLYRLSYPGPSMWARSKISQKLEDCNTLCIKPEMMTNLIVKHIASQPHYHDGHSNKIPDKRIFIANFKCPACYQILPAYSHNMHQF